MSRLRIFTSPRGTSSTGISSGSRTGIGRESRFAARRAIPNHSARCRANSAARSPRNGISAACLVLASAAAEFRMGAWAPLNQSRRLGRSQERHLDFVLLIGWRPYGHSPQSANSSDLPQSNAMRRGAVCSIGPSQHCMERRTCRRLIRADLGRQAYPSMQSTGLDGSSSRAVSFFSGTAGPEASLAILSISKAQVSR